MLCLLEAIKNFRFVVEQNPLSTEAIKNLAKAYIITGKTEEAGKSIARLRELKEFDIADSLEKTTKAM